MRPVSRHGVNKSRSVKEFRRKSHLTKLVNVRSGLARGGIRL